MVNVNGEQITVSTNKIYQLGFLKIFILNRSTKGAITSSFGRAPCSLPSVSKKSAKLLTNNIIDQYDFLKVVVLSRYQKGTMADSVRRIHFSKPFISIKKAIMISLSKIAVSINN